MRVSLTRRIPYALSARFALIKPLQKDVGISTETCDLSACRRRSLKSAPESSELEREISSLAPKGDQRLQKEAAKSKKRV